MNCRKCGSHEYRYVICDLSDCPNLPLRMLIEHDITCGPNDLFEIASNNPPDYPDEEDDVYEPEDYTGDYPLEGETGEDE